MHKLFDVVRTKRALRDKDGCSVELGATGTVLEIYSLNDTVGYNVEFMDANGNTTGVMIVGEADVEIVETKDLDDLSKIVAFPPGAGSAKNTGSPKSKRL